MEKLVVGVIIVGILLAVGLPFTQLFPIPYETSKGEHTGYITAVQKQGLIFKTGRAYVKTDLSTTQEDIYCVMDGEVYKELETLAKSKSQATFGYKGWFSHGITNCEGEGEFIHQVSK